MIRRHMVRGLAATAAAALIIGLLTGCGDDGDSDESTATVVAPTSTAEASQATATGEPAASPTFAIEPTPIVASGSLPPTPTHVAPPPPPPAPTQAVLPPPPPSPPSPVPQGASATIVAHDVKFAPTSLTATAGVPLTVTLDNKDSDVAHDVVFYDATGEVAGRTPLEVGPIVTSVTFTPSAGSYAYRCTVHRNMAGTMSVQ